MRLGQLARKYGVSKKEIISFLKQIDPDSHSLGHNSKLSAQMLTMVAQRFENPELLDEGQQQELEDQQAGSRTGEAIIQSELELPHQEAASELPSDETDKPKKKDEVVIETDKLLELLESEEPQIDLSKITRIKAPKRELEGLKVVGKIELPESKSKPGVKSEQSEDGIKPARNKGNQQQPLTEEEREKRRLKFKKRKEEYEAQKEKQRKSREKKRQKALNKARYQQKLQRVKSSQPKHKDQIPGSPSTLTTREESAPPRTLLGKLWRWLTTY